ncbi:MAG: trehalose synthase [Clostridiales Family XIII bacterium]|jgi:maltose alpha-D-glucosyltransferase/alpha-amylase|nr:trehalose synthase [Clostridiales Family XIII bacterium]
MAAKWYEHAVFYELYTRAFRDSDGDGFGDFSGVLEKLDYLADLGIDAIWFPPFYASPLRDGGYDISDYRAVDPRYGTLEDFEKIIRKAHGLGMKIVLDLVLNHTSDQHPWFRESRKDPTGKYGDYYVWADDDKGYAGTRIIFSETESANWTYDAVRRQYFWHRFYKEQPDLNFDCPAVHEEVLGIADFWASKGVDGFRLDAIPYLYEREGTNNESLSETHAFLVKLRRHLDEHYDCVALLAEACTPIPENVKFFGTDSLPECSLCFNFSLASQLFAAMKLKEVNRLSAVISELYGHLPQNATWSNFLRNHDFLTLELLSPTLEAQMIDWYAPPQGIRNSGIARRLAPLLGYNEAQLRAVTALLISLPGAPCWYYGDELLMADDPALPDRDSVRLPMPWADADKALADSGSFLNWFKETLAFRRKRPALLTGDLEILDGTCAAVLRFRRTIPDKDTVTFEIDFSTDTYRWY